MTLVLKRYIGAPPSLALIASWAEHVQGNRRAIDRELRQVFSKHCVPGLLHTELCRVEGTRTYITTNYDDLLEQTLATRKPHVIVDRGEKGLWVTKAGGSPQQVASTGSQLYELLNDPLTQQPSSPIIFRIHGSVDRNARNDSYLITEEAYVDFLGRSGGYLPPYISALIEGKDFLFLGYSLVDWNVRVILRKLLRRISPGSVRFWAIVRGRSNIEEEVWKSHALNIYPMDLNEFAAELQKYL